MVSAVFDTCILIDCLNGVPEARSAIAAERRPAISTITWMEVMVGAPPAAEAATRSFLEGFVRVEIDEAVAEAAVALRRARRIKLPDAIILASADRLNVPLVTRNTKDFREEDGRVTVPYRRG